MAKRPVEATDWDSLRFEANQYFTPSAPIGVAELFAGRREQIGRLVDVVGERGRHAIIYGEPGVGKTSIAQIVRYAIPSRTGFSTKALGWRFPRRSSLRSFPTTTSGLRR